MLIADKEIVIFDLETTDINECKYIGIAPEIVEIGAVKITSDLEVVDGFRALVRPNNLDMYTKYSEDLIGIKKEELVDSLVWKDIWQRFAKFTNFNRLKLASWGITFDIPVLKSTYNKCNLGYPHNEVPIDLISVVYVKAAEFGLNLTYGLNDVCKRFEIERKVSHRALEDVTASIDVLRALNSLNTEL